MPTARDLSSPAKREMAQPRPGMTAGGHICAKSWKGSLLAAFLSTAARLLMPFTQ
jgi:hypothetical protein